MTDHLTKLHRRNRADARPLTDVQRDALHRGSVSDKGTLVRPSAAVAYVEGEGPWPGFTAQTARILERRGLATVTWDSEGDDIVLDRLGRFVPQGRLRTTDEGRAALRVVVDAPAETLARIGKSDSDEHGHYRDGRDPLDCGEYQDPEGLKAEWARVAGARHAAVRGWQRRRAA